MTDRYYIGLATTFHDPALAIVAPDGSVVFAEAAERFLQYKRAPNCEPDPAPRMGALIARHVPAGAEIVVATSWSAEFSDFLSRSAATGAFGAEALAGLSPELNRSFVPERSERALVASLRLAQERAGLGTLLGIDRAGTGCRFAGLRRYGHHLSHAAYAAWSGPFRDATVLIVDGMGETGASAIFALEDGRLRELRRHRGRGSVGFFFGLVTDLAGFDHAAGEEWKIMGLAPYGRPDPDLAALLGRLYRIEDGRLAFADEAEIRSVAAAILARRPPEAARDGWADLARCGQDAFAAMMDALVAEARGLHGSPNLILAGGCALNSSFNGTAVGRHGVAALHVPSAPADDGNAIGAAWLALAADRPDWRPAAGPASPYLGSSIGTEAFERLPASLGRLRRLAPAAMVEAAADILAEGRLLGWAQGRAEFGPRALGNRSILADPRPADAKDLLNAKVKYREAFRPFAPSILAAHGPDWFEEYQDSPFMERTLRWRAAMRSRVPAVVHADGTGRLQSVTAERNPLYAALIEAFARRTGVPILLNTSFNVMGRPILHSAEDAILMFATTGLDAIAVGEWLLEKE